jgi:hypothetical protein
VVMIAIRSVEDRAVALEAGEWTETGTVPGR